VGRRNEASHSLGDFQFYTVGILASCSDVAEFCQANQLNYDWPYQATNISWGVSRCLPYQLLVTLSLRTGPNEISGICTSVVVHVKNSKHRSLITKPDPVALRNGLWHHFLDMVRRRRHHNKWMPIEFLIVLLMEGILRWDRMSTWIIDHRNGNCTQYSISCRVRHETLILAHVEVVYYSERSSDNNSYCKSLQPGLALLR